MVTSIRRLFSDTHSPAHSLQPTVSDLQPSECQTPHPLSGAQPQPASARLPAPSPPESRASAAPRPANLRPLCLCPAPKPAQPTTDSPQSEVNPQPGSVGALHSRTAAPPHRHTAARRTPASRHPSAPQHLSTSAPQDLPANPTAHGKAPDYRASIGFWY